MTTYNWSSLSNGQQISFKRLLDLLAFDNPAIRAAAVTIGTPTATITRFSLGGKAVTLNGLHRPICRGTQFRRSRREPGRGY